MVQFNKDKARERLRALDYHPVVIELDLTAIANIHPELQAVFDAWLLGDEQMDFEFRGITLPKIKAKKGCDQLNAIFTMSMFIKDPDMIELFESVSPEFFRRRCGGHQVGAE
ncbi:MAG: hypothetical protein WAU91_01525 [Desulfatitalea sp.]